MQAVLQYVLYFAVLVALAVPLGKYIARAMGGERVFLTRLLAPCERGLSKLMRADPQEDMGWKKYAACAMAFHGVGLAALFLILKFQNVLLWNPQGFGGMRWHLAFNTAVSFVTNTNWQTYSGEVALSNFSQAVGLTVQNFVSAACGIAVLFAIIRGFARTRAKGVGNFWTDLTRAVLYIMLPLCLAASVALVDLVEPVALDAQGNVLTGADIDAERDLVAVDG